jgi:predicted amidophosphoribosyltransferase
MVCGKEMKNTLGGHYHCENCGHAVTDLVNRFSNCDIPMPQGFGEQKGWICPVCGRGVAPWVDFCPCQGSEMKITYGTSTGVEQVDSWKEYYDLFEKKNHIELSEA